jgi:hypothetical protein
MKKVSKGIPSEFKKMLSADKSDKYSSKRVITFTAFILISIAFIVNLIWGITVDPIILNGMIQIVWAGLGMVMGEHLLMRRQPRGGGPHGGQHGGPYDPDFPNEQGDPYNQGGSYDDQQDGPYDQEGQGEFGDN